MGSDLFLKQDSGTHEEVKYVTLRNMHLKQFSDCSGSESDKYTESRVKEKVFQKKKVPKNHMVFLIVREC